MNRDQFLSLVEKYIARDPEAAAQVADFVQIGIRKALSGANERAADMEIVVAVLAAKRYKGRDDIVKQKLLKHEGKTALDWAWLTNLQD